MKVLVDVDGVVADFIGMVSEIADVPEEEFRTYSLGDTLDSEALGMVCSAMVRPEFWTELSVMSDAQEGIGRLLSEGYDVVWVTKPYLPCAGWEEARRWWLRMHFPEVPVDNLIITARKELINGHYMINDNPNEIHGWEKQGRLGVLYEAPYNDGSFTWQHYLNGGRFT